MVTPLIRVESLTAIQERLAQLPKETLAKTVVVFDVDEVVVRSLSPFIGSPLFNMYMRQITDAQRLHVYSRLYAETGTELIEPQVFPELLSWLKTNQVAFLFLTSFRHPYFGVIQDGVGARYHELSAHGILKGALNPFSSDDHQMIQAEDKQHAWKGGILFNHPFPKGVALSHFIQAHYLDKFSHIIAVDDYEQNLESIGEQFFFSHQVTLFHYDRPGLYPRTELTKELQEKILVLIKDAIDRNPVVTMKKEEQASL